MQQILTNVQDGPISIAESTSVGVGLSGPVIPISSLVKEVTISGASFNVSPPTDGASELAVSNLTLALQLIDVFGNNLATILLGIDNGAYEFGALGAFVGVPQNSDVFRFSPALLQETADIGAIQIGGSAVAINGDTGAAHNVQLYFSSLVTLE